MPFLRRCLLSLPFLLLMPAPAQAAASLSGTGFGAGLVTPLLLVVHLLGLVALGLWAAEQGGGEQGRIPLVALAAAALLALLYHVGVRVPYTVFVLEGALLVLGGLVMVATAIPGALALVIAVIVGAAQGYHLGAAAGSASAFYWAGLASGWLLAVAAGIGLSAVLREAGSRMAARVFGGVIALFGVLFLLNVI